MNEVPDRIEKTVLLHAPRERVWRAIADAREFGSWFGMALDGPFVAGQRMTAHIVPTSADAEVAKKQEKYRGLPLELAIERLEPMRHFSFRWHPGGLDPKVDYSKEPMTLVAFELEDAAEGTKLTITESGFSKIPLERRAQAFSGNESGWGLQTVLIRNYLERATKKAGVA